MIFIDDILILKVMAATLLIINQQQNQAINLVEKLE